jgi:hypothetical protein
LRTDRYLAFRDMMSVAKLILQLMIGALGKVIRLVGVCGTSSSIDSHKTNSFLIQLLMCLRRVQLILTKTNPTPGLREQ